MALPALGDAEGVQETVVEEAVMEHPAVTNELMGVQVLVEDPDSQEIQTSVTVLMAHAELVVVATVVVPVISQPRMVPHVEWVLVAVVTDPETPNELMTPHKEAVSVSHSLLGSSGNSGGPLGGIVIWGNGGMVP